MTTTDPQISPETDRRAQPLVSIVSPVYNVQPFILHAARSILAQDYLNWEWLVYDDGSTDDTAAILASLDDRRIKVFSDGANRGKPRRMNELLAHASGELVACMDGDDLSYPDRLSTQVRYLADHPDVDLVACALVVFSDDGAVRGGSRPHADHDEITARPYSGFHINQGTWVGRTSWFRKFGYRDDAQFMEDEDLLLRSYRESRFAFIGRPLYGYRVDRLSLRKILNGRRGLVRALGRESIRQRTPRLLLGIPLHLAKALVDLLAVGTGFGFRVLRHRAFGLHQDEIDEFNRVYAELTAE